MVLLIRESDPINLSATMTSSSEPISDAADDDDDDGGLFEFLTATTSDMCAADDVITGGKLLPLRATPPPHEPRKTQAHVPELLHRRSNSWGDSPPPPPPPEKAGARRSSSSGDRPRGLTGGKITTGGYRKLKRVSGMNPDPTRATQQEAKSRPPRWYVLASGPARINPPGIDVKEIRIRRQRRQEAATGKYSGEWGPWKLLQSLSCKGMEAVDIVA